MRPRGQGEQDWEGADGGVMKGHTGLCPPGRAQTLARGRNALGPQVWRSHVALILRLNIRDKP